MTDNDGNTDTALVSIVVEKPDEPSVTVVPTPQFFAPSSDRITLDSTWRVVFDPGLKNIAHTTGLLTDKISGTHGFVLTHQTADEFIEKNGHLSDESEKTIFLLRHNDRLIAEYFSKIGDSLHDYTQQIGDKGFEQGYLLFTYGKNVFVLGKTAQGVFYGVQSLLQILEQSSEAIAGFTIIDYPEIEHRVMYPIGHEDRDDVSDPTLGLALLERMARFKMNGAHFVSGSMQSHLGNMFVPYFHKALQNFIRPILSPSLRQNVGCSVEGYSVENEPFTFSSGVAVADRDDNPGFSNLDFEGGTVGEVPNGWQVQDNSPQEGQWLLTEQESHSGSRSVALVRTAQSKSARPMIFQVAKTPEDSWYLADFWVKTQPGSTGTVQFILYYHDADNKPLFYREKKHKPVDDNTWHPIRLHISKHSRGTKLKIWVRPSPSFRGKVYVDDVALYRMNARLTNVLLDGGHAFRVTAADGSTLYERDKDYELVMTGDPITDRDDIESFSNTVTISRRAGGRIQQNQQVRVSYDYLLRQDKSSSHNMNPYVDCGYDEVKSLFASLRDKLEKSGFSSEDFDVFLAQDEIRGFNMDSRSSAENNANYHAMAIHFGRLHQAVKASFPKSRCYFWADMLNYLHNGGREDYQQEWGGKAGATYPAAYLIDKSIVLIPWNYDTQDANKVIRDSISFFGDAGIRIAGGAGGNVNNIKLWSAVLRGTGNDFYGHAVFRAELSKLEAIEQFGRFSWNTYKGSLLDIVKDGQFELCNNQDDDGDGEIDEDYDLSTNLLHCGKCGNICHVPNGLSRCVEGGCTFVECLVGYRDGNGDLSDGCEVVY